ncbi:MAG TPA: HAD-IIA family hydrolase [Ignavibacteriaceae bacterium]|nr:HAD-IIA family hydrolase [Ignavibacteriaceae bacterium]
MINKYDAFIFDLDGTIYRGESLIKNAEITINELKRIGKKIIFISNKTTGSTRDYYNFLSGKGLNIEIDEILNSTIVLKKHLAENFPGSTFYAIGEEIFIKEISESGLRYSEISDEIDVLLVTLDRTLNYQKLEIAARALEKGARFFAANIDDTCPVDNGEVMDAGATISALEKRTHRKLENHFGKPSDFMFNEITKRMAVDISKVLLIGDRLETDIAMGNKFGIDTALVATGVKNFPNGNRNIKPTFLLDSVFDIIKNGD